MTFYSALTRSRDISSYQQPFVLLTATFHFVLLLIVRAMQAVPSHPGQSGVFVPGKGRRQTVTVEVKKEVRSAAAPQPKYSADESNVFSYKRK